MPHADPTFATHQNLIPFVKSGGYVWAGCHAVSVLENVRYPNPYPANPALAGTLAMNFLSDNGLLSFKSHAGGSVPYSFYKQSGDTRSYYPRRTPSIRSVPVTRSPSSVAGPISPSRTVRSRSTCRRPPRSGASRPRS